jgi:hypothetical protein
MTIFRYFYQSKQNLFLLLLFTGFIFSATAQISIDDSDMPLENDTIRVSTGLNPDFIDYTETGADYTWDFSQMVPVSQRVDTFLSPWSMPLIYKLFFGLTSNLAVRGAENVPLPGFPFTDIFNFYDNRSANYRGIGLGISIGGVPVPFNYDNPDVVYDFPMEYQDKWNSQAYFAQDVPVVGYLKMKRTHTDTVDGWGTLITPFGSFEVLRLKSDVNEQDSIYMDSLGIGIPIERDYTVYQWLGKGQKIPLLQITTSLGGVLAEYIDSLRVIYNGTNDLPFIRNNELQLFPNPGRGAIQLQFEMLEKQNIEVKLFDMQGREVAGLYEGMLQQGAVKLTFNLNNMNLQSGQYILQLRAGGRFVDTKLVYYQ